MTEMTETPSVRANARHAERHAKSRLAKERIEILRMRDLHGNGNCLIGGGSGMEQRPQYR
jgi:hypothetical protein